MLYAKKTFGRLAAAGLLIAAITTSLLATPQITVDNADVNLGIIIEGTQKIIEHVYTLKNTGDVSLHIKSVKPGCGCTVVKFDSVILPGHEGSVASTVNIEAYHGGALKKSMIVNSNAVNTPTLILYIGATIKPIIEIEPSMVTIKAGMSRDSNQVITLRTDKADMKVTDVVLKTVQGGDGSQRQSTLPIYMDFAVVRTEKPDSAGAYHYTLKIGMKDKRSSVRSGELEIATNHPGKKFVTTRIAISQ